MLVRKLFENEDGAFTGDISAKMLAAAGVEFAVVGHSEKESINMRLIKTYRKKLALLSILQ